MNEITYENFGAALSAEALNPFCVDLSRKTIKEILIYYQERKHERGYTNYNIGNVISLIDRLTKIAGMPLMPIHVGRTFYEMVEKELKERGCLPSTIDKYASTIGCIMKWARDYGVKLRPDYADMPHYKFQRQKVTFTQDEISHVYHFDIEAAIPEAKKEYVTRYKKVAVKYFTLNLATGKICKKKGTEMRATKVWANPSAAYHRLQRIETLKRVRDTFVLSCNLYQRYSDLQRINRDCFDLKAGIFSITQQKSGNESVVDLRKMAMDYDAVSDILERYNYECPYKGAINHYNALLKELLGLIGEEFNEDMVVSYKQTNKVVNVKKKRYQDVSSHCGRGVSIAAAAERGMEIQAIMECAGHSDMKMTLRYIKRYKRRRA